MKAPKTRTKHVKEFVNSTFTAPSSLLERAEKKAQKVFGPRSYSKYIRSLLEIDTQKSA